MAAGESRVSSIHSRTASCDTCGARLSCPGDGLDAEHGPSLADVKGPSHLLHKGEHLILAGEVPSALYVIRSGSLKTYRVSDEGEEQILGFRLPGDVVGFDVLFGGTAWTNVAALETSNVCMLPAQPLSRLCDESPTLRGQLFERMNRELQRTTGLLNLERYTADRRVAAFLLCHARNFADRGFSASVFSLSMPRRDIGNFLDVATETVSRVFTRFQQKRIIEARRSEVRVLDFAALEGIARPTSTIEPGVAGII